MKLLKLSAVALAALGMIAISANASHSSSPCNSAFETVDAGAATIYLVNDDTGTWLYLEFNGHESLQRGGAAWYEAGLGTGIDDTCWDRDASGTPIENPDFILF